MPLPEPRAACDNPPGFRKYPLSSQVMGKRDAQLVTQALYMLADARETLENGQRDAALNALEDAQELLRSVTHSPGISVAASGQLLGVSEPTVRSWAKRGALRAVPGTAPMQIESARLHLVSRALNELRERGQDRDWLAALADYLHDHQARRNTPVQEGISQLKRGRLEPA
jgi:DNA-binding transcriptional regulator YdaS (Cro superfamily)